MVIGIDIDDTITETTLSALEHLAKYNCKVLDHHNLSNNDYDEFMELYIKSIMKKANLKVGVRDAFKYLNNSGYKIIIITARNNKYSSEVLRITKEYLQHNDLKYDTIVFDKEKKGECAKRLGVNIFVDDKEIVLDDISKYGIECIRITDDKNSKYKIFSNWNDIINYLKSKEG